MRNCVRPPRKQIREQKTQIRPKEQKAQIRPKEQKDQIRPKEQKDLTIPRVRTRRESKCNAKQVKHLKAQLSRKDKGMKI